MRICNLLNFPSLISGKLHLEPGLLENRPIILKTVLLSPQVAQSCISIQQVESSCHIQNDETHPAGAKNEPSE